MIQAVVSLLVYYLESNLVICQGLIQEKIERNSSKKGNLNKPAVKLFQKIRQSSIVVSSQGFSTLRVKLVFSQQSKNQLDKFASSKYQSTFVLVKFNFIEFFVVVFSVSFIIPYQVSGCFEQIISKIDTSCSSHTGFISFKLDRLRFTPCEASIFGKSILRFETVYGS